MDKGVAVLILDGVYSAVTSDYFRKTGQQPFHPMSEMVMHFKSGIAIAKDHYSLKEFIDPVLGHMADNGIIKKFLAKYIPPNGMFLKIFK